MIIKKKDLGSRQVTPLALQEHAGHHPAVGHMPPQRPHAEPLRSTAPVSEQELSIAAQRMLQQAQERVMMIEKDAYEKGFMQGERTGKEMAEKRVDAQLKRYASTLDEFARLKGDMLLRVEKDVVKLAVAISKRIIQREIQIDQEIILTMARIALSRIGEKSLVTIRLNPIDFKIVIDHKSRLGTPSDLAGMTLVEDHSITRGGCLIDTEMGSVDARIDEQFREIERGLLGN